MTHFPNRRNLLPILIAFIQFGLEKATAILREHDLIKQSSMRNPDEPMPGTPTRLVHGRW